MSKKAKQAKKSSQPKAKKAAKPKSASKAQGGGDAKKRRGAELNMDSADKKISAMGEDFSSVPGKKLRCGICGEPLLETPSEMLLVECSLCKYSFDITRLREYKCDECGTKVELEKQSEKPELLCKTKGCGGIYESRGRSKFQTYHCYRCKQSFGSQKQRGRKADTCFKCGGEAVLSRSVIFQEAECRVCGDTREIFSNWGQPTPRCRGTDCGGELILVSQDQSKDSEVSSSRRFYYRCKDCNTTSYSYQKRDVSACCMHKKHCGGNLIPTGVVSWRSTNPELESSRWEFIGPLEWDVFGSTWKAPPQGHARYAVLNPECLLEKYRKGDGVMRKIVASAITEMADILLEGVVALGVEYKDYLAIQWLGKNANLATKRFPVASHKTLEILLTEDDNTNRVRRIWDAATKAASPGPKKLSMSPLSSFIDKVVASALAVRSHIRNTREHPFVVGPHGTIKDTFSDEQKWSDFLELFGMSLDVAATIRHRLPVPETFFSANTVEDLKTATLESVVLPIVLLFYERRKDYWQANHFKHETAKNGQTYLNESVVKRLVIKRINLKITAV